MSDSPKHDGTRAALIAAALHLFGKQGYAATSTREIAARAGTNVASIAYHFGGKEGLRSACGAAVAERVAQVTGPPQEHGPLSPAEAGAILEAGLRAAVRFLTAASDSEHVVGFMFREMTEPGGVLDEVYARFIEAKHRELCTLWAAATGREAESEETRLAVFATVGQAVYFRFGRPIVLKRMGWASIGPEEAERIADVLVEYLRGAIERNRI